MNIAQINPDGSVIATSRPRAVNVGEGDAMVQYPKGIFIGNSQWTDAELNTIGYARFEEVAIPVGKVSAGHTDTFEGGVVTRTHTLTDPPVIPDATPADEGYNYVMERSRAYPTQNEMIVALWEATVEGRPEAQVALEVQRQAVKTRFPKA